MKSFYSTPPRPGLTTELAPAPQPDQPNSEIVVCISNLHARVSDLADDVQVLTTKLTDCLCPPAPSGDADKSSVPLPGTSPIGRTLNDMQMRLDAIHFQLTTLTSRIQL